MTEKKNIWQILDRVLPPVTNIYGQIRQQKTGVDPFAKEEEKLQVDEIKPAPIVSIPDQRKNNVILIVGGIFVVGIAGYFLIRKFKKNGQKLV
jgi:LPXTG-motif cell wall-anchored protein